MLLVSDCHFATAAFLLFFFGTQHILASTITTAPKSTPTASLPETCEFRTINYITDSLPQQCLKSSWSQDGTSSSKIDNATTSLDGWGNTTVTTTLAESTVNKATESATATGASTVESASPVNSENGKAVDADLESGELSESAFLSFEEWKKQTLEKAGQQNSNIGGRRSDGKKRDSESPQNNFDSIGDDGEIDLDFGAFRRGKGEEDPQASHTGDTEINQESPAAEPNRQDQHRSKDAGKTCKERFNYASFDAGATVLKTHHGAKNYKAVLIENRDSYMLTECATENRFVIIELSEDIWIDTLVLANYEFFSSMIRTFRVSVSDRYPVKIEKWKDLGTYEARNSREIQAFLIENPQIWTRYVRIEFLSHYGNEYYCPISLVRVHGTRMLESWKESEANNEDDDNEENEEANAEEQFIPDAVTDVVQEEERINSELKEAQGAIDELVETAQSLTPEAESARHSSHTGEINASLRDSTLSSMTTPWVPQVFDVVYWLNFLNETGKVEICFCLIEDAPPIINETATNMTIGPARESDPSITPSVNSSALLNDTAPTSSPVSPANAPIPTGNTTVQSNSSISSSTSNATNSSSINETVMPTSSPVASVANKSHNVTSSVKNKTSSTSSASTALPTIQESFFKAVSRRLQLLESNSTLSLKYIEEQSRILREAFSKVEKKQLSKTTNFLDALNSTVFTELREVRQQYDQIWQSTVISLESQRDESRREILAISTRLNILADEVVFQKRMSIIQSVLLLLCLGLVIFSRVSTGGHLDFPNRSRILSGFAAESPLGSAPESPEYRRNTLPSGNQWIKPGHRRQRSDDSAGTIPISGDEDSPPTPISIYSRSIHSFTPPSGGDDMVSALHPTSEYLEPPQSSYSTPRKRSPSSPPSPSLFNSPLWQETSPPASSGALTANSPARTPKKRKPFIRNHQQQPSPSPTPSTEAFPLSLPSTPSHTLLEVDDQSLPPTPASRIGLALSDDSIAPPHLPPSYQRLDTGASTSMDDDGGKGNITRTPSEIDESSPERKRKRDSFSIARKPLPALPRDEEGA